MKPYLIYGTLIAGANAVVTLVLYLAGLHSDPAKLSTANLISLVTALAIGVSLMIVGVRTKRNLTPPTDDFTYGMALGVAVVVSLFATIFSVAFQFVYQSFINPGFADVAIQAQIAAMQAKGVPSENIEKAETFMRMMTKPAVQAITGLIFGIVINVIISLIIAAFMRRKAVVDPTTPPPLATT